jgi:hypothetical protein
MILILPDTTNLHFLLPFFTDLVRGLSVLLIKQPPFGFTFLFFCFVIDFCTGLYHLFSSEYLVFFLLLFKLEIEVIGMGLFFFSSVDL